MALSATKDVHQTTVGSTFLVSDFWKEQQKGPIFEVGRERHDKLFETIFQLHRQPTKEQQQETSGGGGGPNDDRLQVERTVPVFLFHTQKETQPPKLCVYYPHQKINK